MCPHEAQRGGARAAPVSATGGQAGGRFVHTHTHTHTHTQVDEKMPWLSDVLGEQFDKLVSSSSSDSDD
jgi:hypothetical protein